MTLKTYIIFNFFWIKFLIPKMSKCQDSVCFGRPVVDPGEGPRPPPPLFLDQNEARTAENIFFEVGPPTYLKVWMTHPPPLPHLFWIDHSIPLSPIRRDLTQDVRHASRQWHNLVSKTFKRWATALRKSHLI